MKAADIHPHHLELLQAPERWRFIGDTTRLDSDVPSRYRHWYAAHRHAHSHAEIMITLAGQSWYGVGDGHHRIEPGSVLLLDPMLPHQQLYPDFETELEHLWINLMHDVISVGLYTIRGGNHRQTPSMLVPTPGLSSLLSDGAGPHRAVRHLAAASHAVALLLEQLAKPADTTDTAHHHARMVRTIQTHVQRTAGRGDSIHSLARIAGYSRYHFVRIFKQHAGCTVQHYIDHCRRRHVRRQLARQVSRKQIGYELGFSSPQSFSRWCRQHGL